MNEEYSKCKNIFDVTISTEKKDSLFRQEILGYLRSYLPQEVRVASDIHTINYCERYKFIMPNNLCMTANFWFKDSGYISKVDFNGAVTVIDASFAWIEDIARLLKDKLVLVHSSLTFDAFVRQCAFHFVSMPIFNSLQMQVNIIINQWQNHSNNCKCSCIGFHEQQNCIELLFSKAQVRSLWNIYFNKHGMITSQNIKRQCNAAEIQSEIQDVFDRFKSGENISDAAIDSQYEYYRHNQRSQLQQNCRVDGYEQGNSDAMRPDNNGMIDTSPF